MPFNQPTLAELLERTYAHYASLLKPLDKTPRHNILKVMSAVQAGETHQILGDLSFLAEQLFPDTATGDYLRAHWSTRVQPLYAVQAVGTVSLSGAPFAAVPAGLVFSNAAGKRYYTQNSYKINEEGITQASVLAEEAGSESNTAAGVKLSLISSQPNGVDSEALVLPEGITGGVDGESDEVYLARVLNFLRNSARYGRPGDFAAWALDASAGVSKAFEIKNFGVFGALLIQCIGGNHLYGITQVGNLSVIQSYIESVAPPTLFTVRTPELLPINPTIALLPNEDTVENRAFVIERLQAYLSIKAAPSVSFTQGALLSSIVDGIVIKGGTLTVSRGEVTTTVLQYPVLGEITWN